MYGAKMRELRTAQKLGLRELAKRTLIDYTTLSRIENDLKAVTLSQAVVIAKALGCRVEDILQEGKMDELKIREDGIYLNNQKLKGVQAIKAKSTAENGHATIFLKLVAKLI